MRLGKRQVDELVCPTGRKDCLVFDADLKGFCVRVTRDGARVFLLQYRRGDATHRLRLGTYPDITPAQARKLAKLAAGRVAAGENPAEDRRQALRAEAAAREAKRAALAAEVLTVRLLIARWEELALSSRSAAYRREAVRALRMNLARHLDAPAAALDGAAAQLLLDRVAARGAAMARRTQAYGRAMYGWAVKRRLLAGNPFLGTVAEGRDISRDRVLSNAELGEVWRAAGALGSPWDSYLRFLVLTLQREAETAGMGWSELSPDLATWMLPATRTKNRRPHQVQLAEPARALLRALPRRPEVDLVFTTTGRTPLSGFSRAKVRLDLAIVAERAARARQAGAKPATLVPWRLHDLRRTGVTVMARLGVRWEVADKVLNHQTGAIKGVAAVYQRHDFLQEREAALWIWAEHVVRVAVAPIITGRQDD